MSDNSYTYQESEALAILRAGGSFEDASNRSGLSVDDVIALWEKANASS